MTASTDITALERDLLSEISAAGDLATLEQVRIAALGKRGRVSELMVQLGRMAPDERKAFGQAVAGSKVMNQTINRFFGCSRTAVVRLR